MGCEYKIFIPPSSQKVFIRLKRKVSIEDKINLKLSVMPGFRVKWYYNTSGTLDNSFTKFWKSESRKGFSRNDFKYFN